MNATALLCDHAHVSPQENKLFINGGGISRMMTMPTQDGTTVVHFYLAVMVTIPWQATNQRHKLTIELIHDGAGGNAQVTLVDALMPGQPQEELGMIVAEFNAGRGPDMANGEDTLMPVAFPFLGLPVPGPGSYFFNGKIDGSEAFRVPFRVDVPNMGMGGMFPRSA